MDAHAPVAVSYTRTTCNTTGGGESRKKNENGKSIEKMVKIEYLNS